MLGDQLKHFWADRIDHSKKDIQLYSFFYLPMQVVENITNKQFSADYLQTQNRGNNLFLKKVFHWINDFNFWSIGGTSSLILLAQYFCGVRARYTSFTWYGSNITPTAPILSSLFSQQPCYFQKQHCMIDLKAILQQCMAFWLSSLQKNLKDNNTVVCQHHQASLNL